MFPAYGAPCLDHCLLRAGFAVNAKIEEDFFPENGLFICYLSSALFIGYLQSAYISAAWLGSSFLFE